MIPGKIVSTCLCGHIPTPWRCAGFPFPFLAVGQWGTPLGRRSPVHFAVGAPVWPQHNTSHPEPVAVAGQPTEPTPVHTRALDLHQPCSHRPLSAVAVGDAGPMALCGSAPRTEPCRAVVDDLHGRLYASVKQLWEETKHSTGLYSRHELQLDFGANVIR